MLKRKARLKTKFKRICITMCSLVMSPFSCGYIKAKYSGTCVLWTPWGQQKCPGYQGVLVFQVILYEKVTFGTSSKSLDYAGVHILKCPHT